MLYAIIGRDAEDSADKRAANRQAHLARLNLLVDEGRLVIAGPFPAIDSPDPGPAGFTGSLVIAEFDSLNAARQWTAEDPYVLSGAWTGTEVRPFKQVLPG